MPSFHCLMSWSVQNMAWLVCSGVRTVLSTRPSSLTWLKSFAYARLVRGFGPSSRSWDALVRASGFIPGRRRPSTVPGAGCQTPGPGAGGSRSATVGLRSRPSSTRSARIARAACSPVAIPCRLARRSAAVPSGMAAR
jgi:hypothetical protein